MATLSPINPSSIIKKHTPAVEPAKNIASWFKDETLELNFGEYVGRPDKNILLHKEYLTRFLENGWTVDAVLETAEGGNWMQVTREKTDGTTSSNNASSNNSSSSTSSTQSVHNNSNSVSNGNTSNKQKTDSTTNTANKGESDSTTANQQNYVTTTNSDGGNNSSTSSSSTTNHTSNNDYGDGYSNSNYTHSENSNSSTSGNNSSASTTNYSGTNNSTSSERNSSESTSITSGTNVSEGNSKDSEEIQSSSETTNNSSTNTSGNERENKTEDSERNTTTESEGTAYWYSYQRIRLKRRRMQPEMVLQTMVTSFTNEYNSGRSIENSRYEELVSLYATTLSHTEAEANALVSNAMDITPLFDKVVYSVSISLESAQNRAVEMGTDIEQASIADINRQFDALKSEQMANMISNGMFNNTVWASVDAGIERQRAAALTKARAESSQIVVNAYTNIAQVKGSVWTSLISAKQNMADALDKRRTTATEMRNGVLKWMADCIGAKEEVYPQLQEIAQLTERLGFSVGAAGNVL